MLREHPRHAGPSHPVAQSVGEQQAVGADPAPSQVVFANLRHLVADRHDPRLAPLPDQAHGGRPLRAQVLATRVAYLGNAGARVVEERQHGKVPRARARLVDDRSDGLRAQVVDRPRRRLGELDGPDRPCPLEMRGLREADVGRERPYGRDAHVDRRGAAAPGVDEPKAERLDPVPSQVGNLHVVGRHAALGVEPPEQQHEAVAVAGGGVLAEAPPPRHVVEQEVAKQRCEPPHEGPPPNTARDTGASASTIDWCAEGRSRR